jgi:hypothetical protein
MVVGCRCTWELRIEKHLFASREIIMAVMQVTHTGHYNSHDSHKTFIRMSQLSAKSPSKASINEAVVAMRVLNNYY